MRGEAAQISSTLATPRGLEDGVDQDRAVEAGLGLELGEQAVDVVDVLGPLDLGDHDHVERVADLGDGRHEVVESPRRVERVDPRPQLGVAEGPTPWPISISPARAASFSAAGTASSRLASSTSTVGAMSGTLASHLRVGRRQEVDHPRRPERDLAQRLGGADRQRAEEVLRGSHARRHESPAARNLVRHGLGAGRRLAHPLWVYFFGLFAVAVLQLAVPARRAHVPFNVTLFARARRRPSSPCRAQRTVGDDDPGVRWRMSPVGRRGGRRRGRRRCGPGTTPPGGDRCEASQHRAAAWRSLPVRRACRVLTPAEPSAGSGAGPPDGPRSTRLHGHASATRRRAAHRRAEVHQHLVPRPPVTDGHEAVGGRLRPLAGEPLAGDLARTRAMLVSTTATSRRRRTPARPGPCTGRCRAGRAGRRGHRGPRRRGGRPSPSPRRAGCAPGAGSRGPARRRHVAQCGRRAVRRGPGIGRRTPTTSGSRG